MRLALPTAEDNGTSAQISAHFGRTNGFTLYETETGETDFVKHAAGRGPGESLPPTTVVESGADAVIAGNIGRGAVSRLRAADIAVYRGGEGTVEEAIAQWEADALEAVEPEDVHGHGHDDDHDHGHSHGPGEGHNHGHGHNHGQNDKHDHGHISRDEHGQ